MKTSFRFLMYCKDLQKTQRFYSIIGIKWAAPAIESFGPSGLPSHIARFPDPWHRPGEETGLPELIGSFGDTEFWFYFKRSGVRSLKSVFDLFFVKFENPEFVSNALERLKAVELYCPVPGYERSTRIVLADPDGRFIELCGFEMSS